MLKTDVLELISQNGGPKLEFKRDDVQAESLAKEIVAFANMNGGRILMGVEDDGSVSGIRKDNLQEWMMDAVVARHINPQIIPDYEEVCMDEGKRVGVVTVPMGMAKPYELKHRDGCDVYVRYGNALRLAGRDHMVRLFESGGLLSTEKFPVHGSSLDELSGDRWRQYFTEVVGLAEAHEVDESWLTSRGFLMDVGGNRVCSVFSYAFFGHRPGLRLPQAPVRVTVYEGIDKDYETLLDERIDIPYVGLRNKNGIIQPALHQQVINIVKPFISKEVMIDAVRRRQWDYPEEAIREAIVNALVHRDWTKRDCVRLVVYGDRMEIESPGALPDVMTIEKIKHGARSSRNQECVGIFKDYGYMESQGMGVCKKIIPLCVKHSGQEPVFEATEDHFKVTLSKKDADV